MTTAGSNLRPWNPFNFVVSEFRLAFREVGVLLIELLQGFYHSFLSADSCDTALRITDRQETERRTHPARSGRF
jgi:hypothetical protein